MLTVSIHCTAWLNPASAAACKPRITAALYLRFLLSELRSRQAVRQAAVQLLLRGGIAAVIHYNTGQLNGLRRASTPGIIAPWL